jgi:hypothetical protein
VTTPEQIDEIVDRLAVVIETVEAEVRSERQARAGAAVVDD